MQEEIARIRELFSSELKDASTQHRTKYGWTNDWDRLLQIEEGTQVPEDEEIIVECDILKYSPLLVRSVEFFFNPWIIMIACYLYIHAIVGNIILLSDDVGASVITLVSVVQGLISIILIGGVIKGGLLDPIGRNKMVRIRSTELVSTRHFQRQLWPLDCCHALQVYLCEEVACRIFQPFDSHHHLHPLHHRRHQQKHHHKQQLLQYQQQQQQQQQCSHRCCAERVTRGCLRCGKRKVPPENNCGSNPLVQCLFCNACDTSEIRYRKSTQIFQAYGYFDLIEKGTKFTVHNWTKSFIPDRQSEYFISIFISVLTLQTLYVIFIQNAEYVTCRNDFPVDSFKYCGGSSGGFSRYLDSLKGEKDVEINSIFSYNFCCRKNIEFTLFGAFFINNLANTFGAAILIVGLTTLLYGANVLNIMGTAWVQRYREATPDDVSKERRSKQRANRLADLAAEAVRAQQSNQELAAAAAAARAAAREVSVLLSRVLEASRLTVMQHRAAQQQLQQEESLQQLQQQQQQQQQQEPETAAEVFTATVQNQINVSACEAFYVAFDAAFIELRRHNSKGSRLYAAFLALRAAASIADSFAEVVISECSHLHKFVHRRHHSNKNNNSSNSSSSSSSGNNCIDREHSVHYRYLQEAYLKAKSKFLDIDSWSQLEEETAFAAATATDDNVDGDFELQRGQNTKDAEEMLRSLQQALEEYSGNEKNHSNHIYQTISSKYNLLRQQTPDFKKLNKEDMLVSPRLIKLAVAMYQRYSLLLSQARRAAAAAVREDEAARRDESADYCNNNYSSNNYNNSSIGSETQQFLPNRGQDRIYRRMQSIIEQDNERRRRASIVSSSAAIYSYNSSGSGGCGSNEAGRGDVEKGNAAATSAVAERDMSAQSLAYAVAYVGGFYFIENTLLEEASKANSSSSEFTSSTSPSTAATAGPSSTVATAAAATAREEVAATIAQVFLVMGICADVAVLAAAEAVDSWPLELSALYSDVFDIAFAKFDLLSKPKKKQPSSRLERIASRLLPDAATAAAAVDTAAVVEQKQQSQSELLPLIGSNVRTAAASATETEQQQQQELFEGGELVLEDAKEMYCFIEQFSLQSSNLWKVLLAEEFIVRPALLVYAYYEIIVGFSGDSIYHSDLLGNTVWLGSIMTFLLVFYMYAMAYANMVTPRILRALKFLGFCDFRSFGSDRSEIIAFIEERPIEWSVYGFVVNRGLLFSVGGGMLTGLAATIVVTLL